MDKRNKINAIRKIRSMCSIGRFNDILMIENENICVWCIYVLVSIMHRNQEVRFFLNKIIVKRKHNEKKSSKQSGVNAVHLWRV